MRVNEGDDYDYENAGIPYLRQHAYEQAINGGRGQAFLNELRDALLALPEKKLIRGAFCREGAVCALGSVALARKVKKGVPQQDAFKAVEKEMPEDDENDSETDLLDRAEGNLKMSRSLAWAVMYHNDSAYDLTDEQRYERVMNWIESQLRPPQPGKERR